MKTVRKKNNIRRRLTALASAAVLMLGIVVVSASPVSAYSGYVTDTFDVQIKADENNSFDVKETIGVNFYEWGHHGIYRYIPKAGTRIGNISVADQPFEAYTENESVVIKIGDPDRYLYGDNRFRISYRISAFKDVDSKMDRMMLNVIPTGWETSIGKAEATIVLPKKTDLSDVKVYSGGYGTTGNEDEVEFETGDDGRTIHVVAYDLPAYHGITVKLDLPDGYWADAPERGTVPNTSKMLVILAPLLAAILWFLKGRDKHMVQTIEFYPPNDLTPGELGFLIDGSADEKDLVSTFVYLADKGYITIEEDERQRFTLHAVRPIGDDEPQYVRTIYRGLFKSRSSVRIDKLSASFGNSFVRATEELEEQYGFMCSRLISAPSRAVRFVCTLLTALPCFAYAIWMDAAGIDSLFPAATAAVFTVASTMIICDTLDKFRGRPKGKSILRLAFAILMIQMGPGNILLNSNDLLLEIDPVVRIVAAASFFASITVTAFFAVIAIARKDEYTDILGKIIGFRDFIKTAELDKLKMLVEEDPEYFYHITPYAYVFGLSDVWIRNFEDIPMVEPTWYRGGTYSPTFFDGYFMGRMMSGCRASVVKNINIPSNAGRGGGGMFSGGGGFSGGGFSGGGFGGGGGGAW